jgi:hypothetical protein
MFFGDIRTLHVKRDGATMYMYGRDLHIIKCYLTQKKMNKDGLRVGTSTLFQIFGYFMFKGGGAGPPHRVMNYMLSAVS